MSGVGTPRKPYFVNVAHEKTFDTEVGPHSQYSISGAIQETPTFQPHYTEIDVPKHDDEALVWKSKKGAFIGKFSYNATIHNFKPFAALFGGLMDQPNLIRLTIDPLTIAADSQITLEVGGIQKDATANVESISSTDVTLKKFNKNEKVSFAGSGATATLENIEGNVIFIRSVTGTVAADDIMTGDVSGAELKIRVITTTTEFVAWSWVLQSIATDAESGAGFSSSDIDTVLQEVGNPINKAYIRSISGTAPNYVLGIEYIGDSEFADNDILEDPASARNVTVDGAPSPTQIREDTANTSNNAITKIVWQHYIYALGYRCKSKTIIYNYLSKDDQHLMTGCMYNQIEISSAVNEMPKQAIDLLVARRVKDTTKDPNISFVSEPYEYVDFDLDISDGSASEVDYTGLFKSISMSFGRDFEATDTHQAKQPKGFQSSTLDTKLSASIFKEDEVLLDRVDADLDFAVVVTLVRGILGEDDATFYFGDNNATPPINQVKINTPDEAGEKKIMLEVPFKVQGTPWIIVNDEEAVYV